METIAPRAFEDHLRRLFLERGWRDTDGVIAALLAAAARAPDRKLAGKPLSALLPVDFLTRHQIDADVVERALAEGMADIAMGLETAPSPLVPIDDIDSFAEVRGVSAEEVASFSAPLRVPERIMKHCIHTVLGDPYPDIDHGGERADVITPRVVVGGAPLQAAFMLKGPSVSGPLYGSRAGARGDQIVRLISARAQLSVIQHVHQVPVETVDQLRFGLAALRAGDVPDAIGSVWDGVDSARLLRAYGYIESDGRLTPAGAAANEEMKKLGRRTTT
jgi:hypothetical protein